MSLTINNGIDLNPNGPVAEVCVERELASRWASRIAVIVWTLAITGVAIHAFLNPLKHSVFPIYAMAARAWWSGRPLYFQSQPDEFLYSPLFAIFVSPLAFIRGSLGNPLWKILNATSFLLALLVWLKSTRRERLGDGEVSLVLLLVLGESLQSLYDGNANLLMLAAIMLALVALGRAHTTRAGLWLSSAALVKVFPIALVALLAACSGGVILLPFAAALCAGLLLPFAIAPRVALMQTHLWFRLLMARTDEREIRYYSIDQLFRMIGHPLPLLWSNALLVGAGLAVAFLCATYAARANHRDTLTFIFGAFTVWVVMFLPTMEPATIAFISPTIALAIVTAWRRRVYSWLSALMVAWWLCGPALTDVAGRHARIFAEQHCAMFFGSLLFAAYLVSVWRNRSETISSNSGEAVMRPEFTYLGIRVGTFLNGEKRHGSGRPRKTPDSVPAILK